MDEVKIIQPTMRFKARTDLERIYDAVNEYSYGRASKWIINRQLKELDLNCAVKQQSIRKNSNEMDSFSQVQKVLDSDFQEIVNESNISGGVEKKYIINNKGRKEKQLTIQMQRI